MDAIIASSKQARQELCDRLTGDRRLLYPPRQPSVSGFSLLSTFQMPLVLYHTASHLSTCKWPWFLVLVISPTLTSFSLPDFVYVLYLWELSKMINEDEMKIMCNHKHFLSPLDTKDLLLT